MPIIEQEFLDLTSSLDLAAFHAENDLCRAFTVDKPRCSASFSPDDHWIFEFAPVDSTVRYYQDKTYRDTLHRETNTASRRYVGLAFFDEDTWEHSPKRIENLFGSEFEYHEKGTPWLRPVTDDPETFASVLDTVEHVDLETWSLPEPYREEWEHRKRAGRKLPQLGGGSRGPATVMTSILTPETAFFWIYDHPQLMRRFRDLLADKMAAFNKVLRDFSGNDEDGWSITDDNCALFTPDMYAEYCAPVLEHVFAELAPGPAPRAQHSDSSMAHLLDIQYGLGIRSVNYGPDVDAGLIREHMPDAMIHGQLPPFLLRNGSPEDIQSRIVDDFEKAGEGGGLHVTTAGSLAAGTGVGRMRWFMQVVQDGCRYAR